MKKIKLQDIINEAIEGERDSYQPSIKSFDEYKKQSTKNLITQIKGFQELISDGYTFLMSEIQRLWELDGPEHYGFQLNSPEEYLIDLSDTQLANRIETFRKGESDEKSTMLFQDLCGVTDDTMLDLYRVVVAAFQSGDYRNAANAAHFLANLNPNVSSYWLICGKALELNQQISEAWPMYLYATMARPHDAQCYREALGFCQRQKWSDELQAIVEAGTQVLEDIESKEQRKELEAVLVAK